MLGNFPQAFSHVALINTRAEPDDEGRASKEKDPHRRARR